MSRPAGGPGDLRAELFYAANCPLCRVLSRAAVLLALGAVRRVPLSRDDAATFYYQDHPGAGGKPILVHAGRVIAGGAVFRAVPRLVAQVWTARLLGRRAGRTPAAVESQEEAAR